MIEPLRGRRILLGVSGSIAAFKAAALASQLTQAGAQVITLLTRAATEFVTPLTFRGLTGQPAYTDADLWGPHGHILHVDLARQADALVVAPATADTLARLAQGRADTLLSLAALTLRPGTPLVLVPAMDAGMWEHPATQANVATLTARGAVFLGPEEGRLASGLVARGRMMEPEAVLAHVRRLMAVRHGPLRGLRVLVTAGPTWEALDPVRGLTNRSSGRQGYAVAQAALDAGAEVVLVSGPVALTPPVEAQVVPVESARQMHAAVMAHLPGTDMLFKVAAVADYRPAQTAAYKIKKSTEALTVTLVRNPDILQDVAAYRHQHGEPRVVVGFAAESHLDPAALQGKLRAKGLDLLAVNDITAADAGFRVPTNRIRLLYADGRQEDWPLWSKTTVARHLVARAWHLQQESRLWLLVPRADWQAARVAEVYRPERLDAQGFLPLLRPDQPAALAYAAEARRADAYRVEVDARRLRAALDWAPWDGDLVARLHGPLNVDAVVEARAWPSSESPAAA